MRIPVSYDLSSQESCDVLLGRNRIAIYNKWNVRVRNLMVSVAQMVGMKTRSYHCDKDGRTFKWFPKIKMGGYSKKCLQADIHILKCSPLDKR